MSTMTELLDRRPVACPKGHPIYWFHERRHYEERNARAGWWGICAGRPIQHTTRIDVAGACRAVWFWKGESLVTISQLIDPELLVQTIRRLAHQLALFDQPEPPVSDEGEAP